MRTQDINCDVAVIGGGLAGVCAAVAAARQGSKVVLLQNRSVLGGNSSSEIRVWVCGATAHGVHQWARETGIMGELFVENQFTNPEGNPYYWDLVVRQVVRNEPNIDLWLNTDVREVAMDDSGIASVTGWQMGSETVVTVRASAFVDATGDGLVGALAGADFMTGREARSVYNEDWAPEVPDAKTLGSTILFYTKDHGSPSKFVKPEWAINITDIPEKNRRTIRSTMNGCDYWWIEWGGDRDVVDDNELIREELQSVVYGIWDHIKNSGEYDDVENRTLEWIGSVPGKREYRRFIGDYVLTQHDIIGRAEFPDPVAFGGWSIDLHPPGGIYAPDAPSRHWHPLGNYSIPLRCLYSRNVSNLWFAGRNISASHVAFGSTRVMATCAVLGEAAGLGASLAVMNGLTPRELATQHFPLVRNALVRSDAALLGVENTDEADLARSARVTASSEETRLEALPSDDEPRSVIAAERVEVPAEGEDPDHGAELEDVVPLGRGIAQLLPCGTGLEQVEFWLDSSAGATVELTVHGLEKPQDTAPGGSVLATKRATVPAGQGWASFDLSQVATGTDNLFASLTLVDGEASARLGEEPVNGVVAFTRRDLEDGDEWSEQWREWKVVGSLRPFCFRVPGGTSAYAVDNVIGGFGRPFGGPQMWCSSSKDNAPVLTLSWDAPVGLREVHLVLDDDLSVDLINLHHHVTTTEIMPTLLRDYEVESRVGDGDWEPLASVRGNRRRHTRHRLLSTRVVQEMRVRALATNGAPRAHVVKVRAYAD
jgi:hypothetical protein